MPRPEPVATNTVDVHLIDDAGRTLRHSSRWSTLLHSQSSWHQQRNTAPGFRGSRTPGNNVYYERKTRCPKSDTIRDRSRLYTVNPEFIEHLMGYPTGWTHGGAEGILRGLSMQHVWMPVCSAG